MTTAIVFNVTRATSFLNRACDDASSDSERLLALKSLSKMNRESDTGKLVGDLAFQKPEQNDFNDDMQAASNSIMRMQAEQISELEATVARKQALIDTQQEALNTQQSTINIYQNTIAQMEAMLDPLHAAFERQQAKLARTVARLSRIEGDAFTLLDPDWKIERVQPIVESVVAKIAKPIVQERPEPTLAEIVRPITVETGEPVVEPIVRELVQPTVRKKPERTIRDMFRQRTQWVYAEHQRLRAIVRLGLSRGHMALRLGKEFGRPISVRCLDLKMRALGLAPA